MRKAAKAISKYKSLKIYYAKKDDDGKALIKYWTIRVKSIAVINGKGERGNTKQFMLDQELKVQFADKKKSGFYFYFLEYGFRGIPGLRMLDKVCS